MADDDIDKKTLKDHPFSEEAIDAWADRSSTNSGRTILAVMFVTISLISALAFIAATPRPECGGVEAAYGECRAIKSPPAP